MVRAVKGVRAVMPRPPKHWVGNGFNVYPVFAHLAFTKALSPWLMFDYASPKQFEPTKQRRGVGQHPHRGFETVTVAFQGSVEHQDSTGNNDVIGPGDIQWMTAGRGIIHEEYHSTEFAKTGGVFEMCQLWVNLPKKYKMQPPRYQPILSGQVPVVQLKAQGDAAATTGGGAATAGEECATAGGVAGGAGGGQAGVGSVRVIAGELHGVRGPAKIFSPIILWDAALTAQGAVVELPVPAGYNSVVFVRRGAVSVGEAGAEHHVGPQDVALLHLEGDAIRLRAEATISPPYLHHISPISPLYLHHPSACRGRAHSLLTYKPTPTPTPTRTPNPNPNPNPGRGHPAPHPWW